MHFTVDIKYVYMHILIRLKPLFDYAPQWGNCNCPSIHGVVRKIHSLADYRKPNSIRF